jgi:hypothetical protein
MIFIHPGISAMSYEPFRVVSTDLILETVFRNLRLDI